MQIFTEIIYWIINMSLSGTMVGIVIYLLGKIQKLPRRVSFALWALPALRLLLPFSVSSPISYFNLPGEYAPKVVVVPFSDSHIFSSLNHIQYADDYSPIRFESSATERFFEVSGLIYFIIAVSLIMTAIVIYFMSLAELKNSKHSSDNVYISDSILSPSVVGIISPRIILPKYLEGEENEYVLMHERAHIKRKDNLWRMIAVFICCLHWFNPAVWLFLGKFFETLELACDEKVLAGCGEEKKKDYALALIGCEEKKTVFVSAFGGAKTRIRIEKILSYKKLSLFSGFCLTVFIIISAIILLTN